MTFYNDNAAPVGMPQQPQATPSPIGYQQQMAQALQAQQGQQAPGSALNLNGVMQLMQMYKQSQAGAGSTPQIYGADGGAAGGFQQTGGLS